MILALLMLAGSLLASPTPTPWITPTPYVVGGKVLKQHKTTYALKDTKGKVLSIRLDTLKAVQASAGNVGLAVANAGNSEFGCNLSSGEGGTSHFGGIRFFYFVSKDSTLYWRGKAGKLTVIWWD